MFAMPPNVPDYIVFLYGVAGIPASALPTAITDPQTPPALSAVSGGSLGAATYYVKYVLANASGTTAPSPESSLAVAADHVLQVASPAPAQGAVTWAVYAGLTAGSETLQAQGLALGTPWVMPTSGLVAGAALPGANTTADAPVIGVTLALAVDIVNMTLACASPDIYVLAVYNLATDRLINFAPDVPGSQYFSGPATASPPGLRARLNLLTPVTGVVQASSDEATSQSLVVPEQMKTLTLQNLQMLLTPFGRNYLGFAQMYGTAIWGIT